MEKKDLIAKATQTEFDEEFIAKAKTGKLCRRAYGSRKGKWLSGE